MDSSAIFDTTAPLDDSIGAIFIGLLVGAVLYGFCLLQAFLYFQYYEKDSWYIKTSVITLVAFDTIHLSLITSIVYHYVITNYHDPNKLEYITWAVGIQALFVSANSIIVQVYYIYRAWRLSKGYFTFFCAFLLLLVCGYIAASFSWVILTMKMQKWNEMLSISAVSITLLALSCSVDVLIAGSLCILLRRARTGFKHMDTILNRLILFVISTGLLTAIFAVLALVFLLSSPYSLIHGGFYFCIGRLYTNSFLATLNARAAIGRSNGTEPNQSVSGRGTRGSKLGNINIQVQQVNEVVYDEEQTVAMPVNGLDTDSDDDRLTQKGHVLND